MARPGISAESPSTAALAGPLMPGTARQLSRISSAVPWPGISACPRDVHGPGGLSAPGVTHHTARKGNQGDKMMRTASDACWHPLFDDANTSRFIATGVQAEGLHRHRPPCCVGTEQPRRKPAPGQVILDNAGDLLPLPHLLPRPPDQLIWTAMLRLVTSLQTPYADPCGQLHGEQRATDHLPLHPRQRLRSTAPWPSYATGTQGSPRLWQAVGYPQLGTKFPPAAGTADPYHPCCPPSGTASATLVRQPGDRTVCGARPSRSTYRKLDHPF